MGGKAIDWSDDSEEGRVDETREKKRAKKYVLEFWSTCESGLGWFFLSEMAFDISDGPTVGE